MNYMMLEVPARSENESFVRVVIAAFAARLDPTLEEVNEVKTAVSEAVTNSILHAYDDDRGLIKIRAFVEDKKLWIEISDSGKGIDDIARAREPLYTDKPELERSGMGFTIMENFMDEVVISSSPGKGTVVKMLKVFNKVAESSH
ncbi:MAG TPA: anti-sigma F factor [Firmicutes bacterium]|jgi:stage II sporulation protein AB (anti-sigma F factor)|nr:anti-sigma F factor [Bacillota bacterium]HAA34436.1 anti-sigma F factor [Bacillota bacterium]